MTLSIYGKDSGTVEYGMGSVMVDRNSVGGNIDNSDRQQLHTLKKKVEGHTGCQHSDEGNRA